MLLIITLMIRIVLIVLLIIITIRIVRIATSGKRTGFSLLLSKDKARIAG